MKEGAFAPVQKEQRNQGGQGNPLKILREEEEEEQVPGWRRRALLAPPPGEEGEEGGVGVLPGGKGEGRGRQGCL